MPKKLIGVNYISLFKQIFSKYSIETIALLLLIEWFMMSKRLESRTVFTKIFKNYAFAMFFSIFISNKSLKNSKQINKLTISVEIYLLTERHHYV